MFDREIGNSLIDRLDNKLKTNHYESKFGKTISMKSAKILDKLLDKCMKQLPIPRRKEDVNFINSLKFNNLSNKNTEHSKWKDNFQGFVEKMDNQELADLLSVDDDFFNSFVEVYKKNEDMKTPDKFHDYLKKNHSKMAETFIKALVNLGSNGSGKLERALKMPGKSVIESKLTEKILNLKKVPKELWDSSSKVKSLKKEIGDLFAILDSVYFIDQIKDNLSKGSEVANKESELVKHKQKLESHIKKVFNELDEQLEFTKTKKKIVKELLEERTKNLKEIPAKSSKSKDESMNEFQEEVRKRMEVKTKEFTEKISKELKGIKAESIKCTKEIDDLKAKAQALRIDHNKLRNDYFALQPKVIADYRQENS